MRMWWRMNIMLEMAPDGRQTVRPTRSFQSWTVLSRRADNHGLRCVVVGSDESHLAVALHVVTHRRDDEIDVAVGDQRNTGLGVHGDRHEANVKKVGDATGDIDFEA